MSKCFVLTLPSSSRFFKSPILFLLGFQVPTNLPLSSVTHCLRCTGDLPSSCHVSVPSPAHPFFLLCYPGPFLPTRTSPALRVRVLVAPGGSAPNPRPRGNALSWTRHLRPPAVPLFHCPLPPPAAGKRPRLPSSAPAPPARRSLGRARPRHPTRCLPLPRGAAGAAGARERESGRACALTASPSGDPGRCRSR